MSETNNNKQQQSKIYVPGTQIKEFTFPSGDKVLRFSINLSKFAPFVKQHKNENGYINFNINPRREIGPYGDSHTCSLDQWQPQAKTEATAKNKSTKPVEKKEIKKTVPAPEPDEEFV